MIRHLAQVEELAPRRREPVGAHDKGEFVRGDDGEVELVVEDLVFVPAVEVAEVARVGARAEGYDLYVLLGVRVDEVLDQAVDYDRADVGSWGRRALVGWDQGDAEGGWGSTSVYDGHAQGRSISAYVGDKFADVGVLQVATCNSTASGAVGISICLANHLVPVYRCWTSASCAGPPPTTPTAASAITAHGEQIGNSRCSHGGSGGIS